MFRLGTLTPTSIAVIFGLIILGIGILLNRENASIKDNIATATISPATDYNNTQSNMSRRAAAICISHGGGPMPVLGDPSHANLVASMKTRVPKLLRLNTPDAPRAIVVVTAHWSTTVPSLSSAPSHSLYYDYGGFPAEAYRLKYPAPGSPSVAQEVAAALKKQGFSKTVLDEERGWDHGVFIPFLLIHPKADVPIVQMSVLDSEDPEEHFRMGLALRELRSQNVAVVGSGFPSMHNLRIMFGLDPLRDPSGFKEFKGRMDSWSQQVGNAAGEKGEGERRKKLAGWRGFGDSYIMHPRGGAEHFLPLIVVAGSAMEGEEMGSYADEQRGLTHWSYHWGGEKL